MKTKEYIKKHFSEGRYNQNNFMRDLTDELVAQLEYNQATDNLKGFNNAVRVIHMKFQAIANKAAGRITDAQWNYFFATVVIPLRDEMCSREVAQKEKIRREKQDAWEKRRRERDDLYGDASSIFEEYRRRFIQSLFGKIQQCPNDAFSLLELPTDADAHMVKKSYRKLSMKHHPDKGGKQEMFIKITTAKNKCVEWINRTLA